MKKLLLTFFLLALTSVGYSQVIDTVDHSIEAQQLIEKQQKEQQQLLEKQQKEQDKFLEQQQKEAAAAAKEQQKAEEAAAKQLAKEQKEAEKAEKRAIAEQKLIEKQQREARRAERRERIGRTWKRSFDPFAQLGCNAIFGDAPDLRFGTPAAFGMGILVHYPLAKHWDLDLGLNYRAGFYLFSNGVNYDAVSDDLVSSVPANYVRERDRIFTQTIQLPILMSYVGEEGQQFFAGVKLGYNFINKFVHSSWDGSEWNKVSTDLKSRSVVNRYRVDLTIGTMEQWLVFAHGFELYYNLVPTFVGGDKKIHEFGIGIRL